MSTDQIVTTQAHVLASLEVLALSTELASLEGLGVSRTFIAFCSCGGKFVGLIPSDAAGFQATHRRQALESTRKLAQTQAQAAEDDENENSDEETRYPVRCPAEWCTSTEDHHHPTKLLPGTVYCALEGCVAPDGGDGVSPVYLPRTEQLRDGKPVQS